MPISKQLDYGMSGDDVKQLQQFLISKGYQIQAGATGYFGDQTKSALQKFQKDNGIDAVGRVGPETLRIVNSNSSATPKEGDIKDDTTAGIRYRYSGGQWQPYQSIAKTPEQNQNTPPASNPPATPPADNPPPSNNQNTYPSYASSGVGVSNYSLPDDIANNPDLLSLPNDMQQYITYYYNLLKTNDTQAQKKLKDAMEEAKKQADPYWKQAIDIAQDDLKRTLGELTSSYDDREKELNTKIARIKEDLATGKNDLSIDEQADLARLKVKYEQDLENLQENASATGLTYSSKRTQAETRLSDQNTDIVESTSREYMRKSRDLELAASRGEADAISQLAEYKRRLGEEQIKALRSTEAKIGTENLPTGLNLQPGVSALGNIGGDYQESKLKDILTRATALSSLGNPFL